MDDFQQMMIAHVQKTEEHMASVNAHMVQARQARAAHDKSINCLKDNFVAFRDEYGPILKATVSRKKWWAERIEETQKKTALAVCSGVVLALAYGLGHGVNFLYSKAAKFIGGA